MIAIPIDAQSTTSKSSKLFGNVKYFALFKPDINDFAFVVNKKAGDGVATAKFLKDLEVNDVVYSFMGNGPFEQLHADGITIHYLGKEPQNLTHIVNEVAQGTYLKVDLSNASMLLDPGTTTGNCECGCT